GLWWEGCGRFNPPENRSGSRSDPCKNLPLPRVEIADQQYRKKDRHLDCAEPSQLFEADGPREEENRLHVEDDEKNGDQEVPHREAVVKSERAGGDTALVRLELHLVRPRRPHERRKDEKRENRHRNDDERSYQQHRIVGHIVLVARPRVIVNGTAG